MNCDRFTSFFPFFPPPPPPENTYYTRMNGDENKAVLALAPTGSNNQRKMVKFI